MIFIEVDSNNIVTSRHNMPFHEVHGLGKTKEELERVGFLVESIAEPTDQPGMMALLKYNSVSKELFYEYVDRELTPEEKIVQLESEKEVLKRQQAQLNADLTAFMDYYFTSTSGN